MLNSDLQKQRETQTPITRACSCFKWKWRIHCDLTLFVQKKGTTYTVHVATLHNIFSSFFEFSRKLSLILYPLQYYACSNFVPENIKNHTGKCLTNASNYLIKAIDAKCLPPLVLSGPDADEESCRGYTLLLDHQYDNSLQLLNVVYPWQQIFLKIENYTVDLEQSLTFELKINEKQLFRP